MLREATGWDQLGAARGPLPSHAKLQAAFDGLHEDYTAGLFPGPGHEAGSPSAADGLPACVIGKISSMAELHTRDPSSYRAMQEGWHRELPLVELVRAVFKREDGTNALDGWDDAEEVAAQHAAHVTLNGVEEGRNDDILVGDAFNPKKQQHTKKEIVATQVAMYSQQLHNSESRGSHRDVAVYFGGDGLDDWKRNLAVGGMSAALVQHAGTGTVIDNPHYTEAGSNSSDGGDGRVGGGAQGSQSNVSRGTCANVVGGSCLPSSACTPRHSEDDRNPRLLDHPNPKRIRFVLFLVSLDGAALRYLSGYDYLARRQWHFGTAYSSVPQGLAQAMPVTDRDNPLHGSALIGCSLAHHSLADNLLRKGKFGAEAVTYRTGSKQQTAPRRWVEFGCSRDGAAPASPVGLERMMEEPFHCCATWPKHLVTEICATCVAVGKGKQIKQSFETAWLRHNARSQMEALREAKHLEWLRKEPVLVGRFKRERDVLHWLDKDPCWDPLRVPNRSSERMRMRAMALRFKAPRVPNGDVRCKTKAGMVAETCEILADDIFPPQLGLDADVQGILQDLWTLNRFMVMTLRSNDAVDFATRLKSFAPVIRTLFDLVSHHFGEIAPKPKLQAILHILPFFLFKLARRAKVPDNTTMKTLEAMHALFKQLICITQLGGTEPKAAGASEGKEAEDHTAAATTTRRERRFLRRTWIRRFHRRRHLNGAIPSRAAWAKVCRSQGRPGRHMEDRNGWGGAAADTGSTTNDPNAGSDWEEGSSSEDSDDEAADGDGSGGSSDSGDEDDATHIGPPADALAFANLMNSAVQTDRALWAEPARREVQEVGTGAEGGLEGAEGSTAALGGVAADAQAGDGVAEEGGVLSLAELRRTLTAKLCVRLALGGGQAALDTEKLKKVMRAVEQLAPCVEPRHFTAADEAIRATIAEVEGKDGRGYNQRELKTVISISVSSYVCTVAAPTTAAAAAAPTAAVPTAAVPTTAVVATTAAPTATVGAPDAPAPAAAAAAAAAVAPTGERNTSDRIEASKKFPLSVKAKFTRSDRSLTFERVDVDLHKARGEAGDGAKVKWRVPFDHIMGLRVEGSTLVFDIAQPPQAWSYVKGRAKGAIGKWVAGELPIASMKSSARHTVQVDKGGPATQSLADMLRCMMLFDARGESLRLAALPDLPAVPPRFGGAACMQRVKEAAAMPIAACRKPLTSAKVLGGEVWERHEEGHLVRLARLVRFLLYGGCEKASGWGFPHQCGDCPCVDGARPWCGYTSHGVKVLLGVQGLPEHFVCNGVLEKHKAWLDAKVTGTVELGLFASTPDGDWRTFVDAEKALNPLYGGEPRAGAVAAAAPTTGEAAATGAGGGLGGAPLGGLF